MSKESKVLLHNEQSNNTDFSSRDFRNAMGQFASGVVIISAQTSNGVHAMTANAFMSGSLEPPMVVVSVGKHARMHEFIKGAHSFGVSVLRSTQEKVSNHFAGRPSHDHEPVFWELNGVPVVSGAVVQLGANLVHSYDCGDHTLYVGHVQSLHSSTNENEVARPLLFFCGRYGAIARSEWSQESAPDIIFQEGERW